VVDAIPTLAWAARVDGSADLAHHRTPRSFTAQRIDGSCGLSFGWQRCRRCRKLAKNSINIMAFLLQKNGVPAGATPLDDTVDLSKALPSKKCHILLIPSVLGEGYLVPGPLVARWWKGTYRP
jgi:hypothetical protein